MAVNNRNHAVIIQVLNILYNEADGTDDVDGGGGRSCCERNPLRQAVLQATSNDDPGTLAALVKWARSNNEVELEESICSCAMLVACLGSIYFVMLY